MACRTAHVDDAVIKEPAVVRHDVENPARAAARIGVDVAPRVTEILADCESAVGSDIDLGRTKQVDGNPECRGFGLYRTGLTEPRRRDGCRRMDPIGAGVKADIDAREAVHASVVERRRVDAIGENRIHLDVPHGLWKVVFKRHPGASTVERLVKTAPLAGGVEDIIVEPDACDSTDATGSPTVRVGRIEIRPAWVDVGKDKLTEGERRADEQQTEEWSQKHRSSAT